jgi:hypothetical protein
MVFTRYLFYTPNVVCSLFISIFDNNVEEALFWGYELYYSGFVNVLLEYLIYFSENFYKLNQLKTIIDIKSNIKFIRKKYNEFITLPKTDQTRDCIIGTIIRNLTLCKTNTTSKTIRIIYKDKDIIKYREPIVAIKPYLFLSLNCIYPVRTNTGSLIIPKQFIENDYNYKEILKIWRTGWEYYSAKTPFWWNIFELFSGSLNHQKKTIEFKNDGCEERFYEKYGYEPDEQSEEIRIKCLGNEIMDL